MLQKMYIIGIAIADAQSNMILVMERKKDRMYGLKYGKQQKKVIK